MADKKAVNTAAQAQSDKTKKTSFFGKVKNFFKGIGKYFKDTKGELKKVVWPTASTTAKNTGTVLLCSLVVGACIWIFDYVAVSAVHLLIGLAG